MDEKTTQVLTGFYEGKSLRALQGVRRTRKAVLAREIAAGHVLPVDRRHIDYTRAEVALIEAVIEGKKA